MYEAGLPEALHLAVPPHSEPQELFLLTVGTLGDVAEMVNNAENIEVALSSPMVDELNFSASFFDAIMEAKFAESVAKDTALLAASAYYLSRRPGSSLVLARRLVLEPEPICRGKAPTLDASSSMGRLSG